MKRRPISGWWVVASWLVAGCGPNPPKNGANNAAASNPATAPLDYLAAQGRAKKQAEKVTSLAQVQQAIQQFQAMEDRWPRDLGELAEKRFLTDVPVAPAGYLYTYNPANGQVRVVQPGQAPAAARPAPGAGGVLQRARQLRPGPSTLPAP
ncbi:MAG: hypothetical protein ACKO3N_01105 [Verrucomicrobiota bacterium]